MSSNFSAFTKFPTNQILKISGVHPMWNPETRQDAPNQGQDDLVLLISTWILIFEL